MPSPSSGTAWASLDSLRGLFALWVAMGHAIQWLKPITDGAADYLPFLARPSHAVPLFCVLSGMLVTRSLGEFDADGLRRYFGRRLRRIYPLYVLTIALTLLYFPGHYLATDGTRGTVPAFFVSRILGDLLMLKTAGYGGVVFNVPAWSLYVEVLFYLVLPAVVILARGRLVPVGLGVYVAFVVCGYDAGDAVKLVAYFGLGMALAAWAEKPPRIGPPWLLAAVGCAMIFLDVAVEWRAILPNILNFAIGYAGFKGPGLVLVILALLASPALRRPLEWRPLRVIGVVSYSIFLLHPFVIAADFALRTDAKRIDHLVVPAVDPVWWIVPLVYAPAFILWAAVSFALVERPFLMRGRQPAIA